MTEQHRCKAEWVVGGEEQVCGAPATQSVFFEGDVLEACDRCSADLSDFELYRIERELTAAKAALDSWGVT